MRAIGVLLFIPAMVAFAKPSGVDGEWAKDWAEAAGRARDQKKLVLVAVELYAGLQIPDRIPPLFEEGTLADLLRSRFVGLRWKQGMKAPFQDPSVYGMGAHTFGAGILVATPDGAIVGQCIPLTSLILDQFLCSMLRARPEFRGLSLGEFSDPLDRAEAHLKRGEFEEAEALLRASAVTVRSLRLQARRCIRLRKGPEAREALRRARELAGPDEAADLSAEEGLVLVGLGKLGEAASSFRSVPPAHPRGPEARFWLSRILLRESPADARAGFEELLKTAPGSRWGKAAAALLAPGGLETATLMRLAWPADAALDVVRDVKPHPLETAEAARATDGAIRFLIRSQQADGSWITPACLTSEAPAFSIATTAICALSLLPYRKQKDVDLAVGRALEFVLAAQASGALDRQGRTFGFGYSIWGRVFALRLLSRCSREGIGPAPRVSSALQPLARELERDQTAAGGWSYYAGLDPAFVTGAVLLALFDGREAGAVVSEETLRRGLANLAGARAAPGKFRYSPGGAEPRAEAGLRSPMCELALQRGGKGEPGALGAALDHFLASRLEVRRERGKALCHTGPDGTASYYLLFGYAFSSEALGRLPQEKRDVYRKALLEDVLAARLDDGSFLDTPTMGRYYGTGMALIALARLAP